MSAVAPAPRVRPRNADRKRIYIVAAIIVLALGFLLWRGLSNATEFFRTADEAVSQRQQLGHKRFRLEGVVVPGSIKSNGTYTDFAVSSKNTIVQVHNSGQPLGIFQQNIPVVLEGAFAPGSNVFDSDQIMVKHSADYTEAHPDRVSGQANK